MTPAVAGAGPVKQAVGVACWQFRGERVDLGEERILLLIVVDEREEGGGAAVDIGMQLSEIGEVEHGRTPSKLPGNRPVPAGMTHPG
jgi:hypothetical protein